jgi:hypothetical protein
MSIYVTSAAWKNSRASGATLLMLLAICDFADDEGRAFPSIKTLAEKSRICERTAQYSVTELINLQELVVTRGAGPKGCNLYHVQVQNLRGAYFAGVHSATGGVQSTTGGGAIHDIKGVHVAAPEPSLEPSYEPSLEPSVANAAKKSTKPEKIGFDKELGTFTNIDEQCAMDFALAYPDVHLDAEVRRAAIWVKANPLTAPKSNFARFLASWLSRSQNKIDLAKATGQKAPVNFTDQRRNFIDGLTGRGRAVANFTGDTFDA